MNTEYKQIAENFCNQRFEQIKQNKGAVPLKNSGNAIVLHIIPLSDFVENRHNEEINPERLYHDICPFGVHFFPEHKAHDFELIEDGFLGYYYNKNGCSYTKVFQSGLIEAVFDNFKTGFYDPADNNSNFVSANHLSRIFVEAFEWDMWFLENIKASTPILLRTSYFGMKGVSFKDLNEEETEKKCFEQNEILAPSTIIYEYNKGNNSYKNAMKEQFEYIFKLIGINGFPSWMIIFGDQN